jgi:predicted ABC-type transport system involved in lysophospholipase L1 biosynthesis ATPase subunit
MSVLSLDHVSKRYPDGRAALTALDDVSLEIDEGDFIGIWGMRRSGKTTLLRVAAGREPPDEGVVRFDNCDLARMSPDERARMQRHRGIELLSTDWRPDRNRPALECVALPLLADGMSLREACGPAWRALEQAGAGSYAHILAGQLAQSERTRVALALTLVHEPRVLLIDEPAVLLTPREEVELYDLLRELGRDRGLSVVIASEEIAAIRKAQRTMTIDRGRLRCEDQPGELVHLHERSPTRKRGTP